MLLLTDAKPYRAGKNPNYVSKDKHCTHIGNNVNASYVEQYKVDGEVFPAGSGPERCDFLLLNENARTAYYIELKGSSIPKAIQQLNNTVSMLRERHPQCNKIFYRIIYRSGTGAYANQQFTFKVFNNAALTSQVGSTQYLSPGRSFSITLDPDRTYYVAEVAENGWNCTTPGVSTKTVNGVTYYYCSITPSAGGTYSVSFNNEPVIRRNISLQKGINTPTSCTGLIRNNAMYSLAGAEYSVSLNGVYQETLVTDANGYATSSYTLAEPIDPWKSDAGANSVRIYDS